jgi:hypothetical protein
MAVDLTASMEIEGLKESLKIINKVDKKLRLEIGRDIKRIGEKTVVAAIKEMLPSGAPMSGMENAKRTGWYNSKNKGVKVKTNTRGARRRNISQGAKYETIAVITVGTTGAALAMMDMAGKGPNRTRNTNPKLARPNFVQVLNERLGHGPSRFMWPGGEKAIPDFQRELGPTIDRVIYRSNQELMKVNR